MFSLDMFSTSSLWDCPPLYLHDLLEVFHVLSGYVLHILPLEAVLHYTSMISWMIFMISL